MELGDDNSEGVGGKVTVGTVCDSFGRIGGINTQEINNFVSDHDLPPVHNRVKFKENLGAVRYIKFNTSNFYLCTTENNTMLHNAYTIIFLQEGPEKDKWERPCVLQRGQRNQEKEGI